MRPWIEFLYKKRVNATDIRGDAIADGLSDEPASFEQVDYDKNMAE